MTLQFLEYNGIMVPVHKYIELKAQEKSGIDPKISTLVEDKPEPQEKIEDKPE